jgi:serine/threonine-protein kinase
VQVANKHPQLVDELKDLWSAAVVADELATISLQDVDGASVDSNDAGGLKSIGRYGDYELMEELGRGGMGVVYKARQVSLDRWVAVKKMIRGSVASPAEAVRFRAEAESAAKLDHPNIVAVHEIGEWDGEPFFSMRYVEGVTLARRLADGPLEARAAAKLLADVCRAVAAAHRSGVLHRDLKPSNILIDGEGRPLVADFGLAKRVETKGDLTQTGAVIGTPSYMSPEQASPKRGAIGPASDVYSLGAVLYHMLTGRPPFQAPSSMDVLWMVLEQDPVPPQALNARVDPDLQMIALKCLEKTPALRYASADALADDLDAYLANEPVSARTTSAARWLRRMFRETHHAALLEAWGGLWMSHAGVILVLCLLTNWLHFRGVESPTPYLLIWTVGLGAWAALFWSLRRLGGPITFVERQIAHLWAVGVISATMLFLVEILMQLPVLTLSPVLAIIGGAIFLVKGSILSGEFYIQSAANFLCALAMARFPSIGVSLFGIVNSLSFFAAGWKYRRRRHASREASA